LPVCENLKVTKTLTISIVDDDESMREATSALIRSLGYVARAFASAEEFLDSDHVVNTDCLITDIHMPGLSGVELHERLMENGLRVPVIFVTAYPDEKTQYRALKAGAAGYLSKPFNEKHLITQLDLALAGHGSCARKGLRQSVLQGRS